MPRPLIPPPYFSIHLHNNQVHPGDVAAIILEPVLGEGGFLTPPPGFMEALRQLADKHGIMLIADEVRYFHALFFMLILVTFTCVACVTCNY